MYKYDVSFTDFNGNPRKETLWFHISKSSVLMAKDDVYSTIMKLGRELQENSALIEEAQKKMDVSNPFDENAITVNQGVRTMAQLLDRILDLSYGKRSEDGMSFDKSSSVLEAWKNSLSYEALLDDLLGNPEKMIDFVQRITKQ